jgi:hypothetical protein
MESPGGPSPVWSLLTLRGTRSLLTGRGYRILVGGIGLGYAFAAMVFSGMLYFPPHPLATGTFFYILPHGPGASWMYPALLAGDPSFQLYLPFLSAILMTLTAAGVGLGMTLGVFLGVRLIRHRRAGLLGPTTVGAAAGFTPAMIALVTLGACCSTTAAATAGISLAAQSSGATTATLLANSWYLGLFQVVVVYVALIAQEQLLGVYGLLLAGGAPASAALARLGASTTGGSPRAVGAAALRIALLVAGLTWSLSVFVSWVVTPPGDAGAAGWFGGIVQHEVPGILAVMVALFPEGTRAWWARVAQRGPGRAMRALLVASGLALLSWMPVPLSAAGAAALGNEILGFGHFPAAWGAIAPPDLGLPGLLLRWAFQFSLLGIFAVWMGISPQRALRPFLRPASPSPDVPAATPGREPSPA